MKKILPLQTPFVTTFPKDANAVSILLNYPEAYPWLMNCFIQLTCWGNQFLDYYDFHYRNCPLLEYQRVKKGLVGETAKEQLDFIYSSLKQGYYIMLPVKTKYISEYGFDSIHDMLVYGYDENDKFYIADNFANGVYRKGSCTRIELKQAVENLSEHEYWYNGYRGTIEMLSYNPEKRAVFEPYRIKESIQDYLWSDTSKNWYVSYAMWDSNETENRCFGMQCYNALFKHLEKAKEGEDDTSSLRAFHLEYEHKKIMSLRLKWLNKNYGLNNSYLIQYKKIEEMASIALMLYLKFKATYNLDIIKRINEIYRHIVEKEEQILEKLLCEL